MENPQTKGIILAAGFGTRLYPSTIVTSKQLLPVYDMPMIFYPLDVLIKGGVKDILIIVPPDHSGHFINLLGSILEKYKIQISFKVQSVPKGLPDAFILGENHIDNNNVALILGDNIFEDNFSEAIKNFKSGGKLFIKKVPDPEKFGVVKFDEANKPEKIVEKPVEWISDYAITGLYLFDHNVVELAKTLKPSTRGEMEIVDVHNYYLNKNELELVKFDGEWLDAGNSDALLEASIIVKDKKISENFDPLFKQAIEEYSARQKEILKKRMA